MSHATNITPGRPRSARAPKVHVEVTQTLIDEAVRADSGHCMIAEAVKAAVPGARSVSVDLQTVRFTDPKLPRRYVYLTPRRGQVALVNWDQGRKPEPFELNLRGGSVHRAADKTSQPHSNQVASPEPPTRVRLVRRRDESNGEIPEVVGGKTPPRAALASPTPSGGRRRQFGLRAFER